MSSLGPAEPTGDGAWRVGADIGGTFTDIVAVRPDGGLVRLKVPSTVDDFGRGISAALEAHLAPEERRAVSQVVHGTTVATNAILEGTTRRLALITTEGFRDVLDLRRSRRPTLYDLTWTPPPPLVPRELRLEVPERLAADGSVVTPLDEDAVRRLAATIRAGEVEAVAVCLLHAYANPAHERRIAEILTGEIPGLRITLSSTIAPEAGEYERTSTTAVNAFLLPVVDDYVTRLESALEVLGVHAPLQIMQSDGTTAAAAVMRERPFLMIESGPAAGVSAAARLADEMGRDAIVTFDMGGTTAKASLVEERRVDLTEELEVGDALNRGGGFMRGSGYVVRAACVDLTEVGSGGGSIAWIDGGGALRVGPRSAGSAPGPACYDGGGTEATVTDAHVVLGYVNPVAIAGGAKPLRADLADAAVGQLASRLGLSVEDTAHGICAIATATMRRAVRAVSVERGRDARLHSLVAFGGAGGLHAAALADEMEMPEVIVPVVAGLFSSLGLLFADTAITRVAALRLPLTEDTRARVAALAASLSVEARDELDARHGAGETPEIQVLLNLRYVGQLSTLMLAFDAAADLRALTDAFHREHRRAYGQSAEHESVEVVAVRVRAARSAPVLTFADLARQELAAAPPPVRAARRLYFGPTVGWLDAVILTRAALAGAPLAGPAVIEEPEATILVPPGFVAALDPTGSVVLTRGSG